MTLRPNDSAKAAEVILDLYRRRERGAPTRISRAGVEAFDRAALAGELARALIDIGEVT